MESMAFTDLRIPVDGSSLFECDCIWLARFFHAAKAIYGYLVKMMARVRVGVSVDTTMIAYGLTERCIRTNERRIRSVSHHNHSSLCIRAFKRPWTLMRRTSYRIAYSDVNPSTTSTHLCKKGTARFDDTVRTPTQRSRQGPIMGKPNEYLILRVANLILPPSQNESSIMDRRLSVLPSITCPRRSPQPSSTAALPIKPEAHSSQQPKSTPPKPSAVGASNKKRSKPRKAKEIRWSIRGSNSRPWRY